MKAEKSKSNHMVVSLLMNEVAAVLDNLILGEVCNNCFTIPKVYVSLSISILNKERKVLKN